MRHLTFYHSLGFKTPALISIFGAGGKSTIKRRLADEIVAAGEKALLTTTTMIYRPAGMDLFIDKDMATVTARLREHFRHNNLAVLGSDIIPGGKIKGVDPELIGYLQENLPVSILVEADGARGKPLKGYAPYEPVIPPSSDLILSVIGADILGLIPEPSSVHRFSEFTRATGAPLKKPVTENLLVSAFNYMMTRGLKQAPRAKAVYVLNKADLLENPGTTALNLARGLSVAGGFDGFLLVAAAAAENPVKVILRTGNNNALPLISCVILAAGRSLRMGKNKLTLRWKDITVLEQTLVEAARSGADEIIVVTGPGQELHERIRKRGGRPVINPDYAAGLSGSVVKGMNAVNPQSQGVIFAPADQPQVGSNVYTALKEKHAESLPPCVYPSYRKTRGNPVLFDRLTWPELINLSGDRGARLLIKKFAGKDPVAVEVETPEILFDLDSPDDYLYLLENYKS